MNSNMGTLTRETSKENNLTGSGSGCYLSRKAYSGKNRGGKRGRYLLGPYQGPSTWKKKMEGLSKYLRVKARRGTQKKTETQPGDHLFTRRREGKVQASGSR